MSLQFMVPSGCLSFFKRQYIKRKHLILNKLKWFLEKKITGRIRR